MSNYFELFKYIFKQGSTTVIILLLSVLCSIIELINVTFIGVVIGESFNGSERIIPEALEIIYNYRYLISLTLLISTSLFGGWMVIKLNQQSALIGSRIFAESLRKYFFSETGSQEGIDFIKDVGANSNRLVTGVLNPAFMLFSKLSLLVLAIIFFTVYLGLIYPLIIIFIGISLFIPIYYLRKVIRSNGKIISDSDDHRFKSYLSTINFRDEILVNGLFDKFSNKIKKHSDKNLYHLGKGMGLSALPRYMIEAIVYLGLILIIWLSAFESKDIDVTKISVVVLCMLKILPSMQIVFSSMGRISGNIQIFHELIRMEDTIYKNELYLKNSNTDEKIINQITWKNLKVKYDKKVVRIPDGELKRNRLNMIIGKSGTGKSTLLKTLMGLTEFDGAIYINYENKKEEKTIHPSSVSYCGQFPALLPDLDVLENINVISSRPVSNDEVKKYFKLFNLSESLDIDSVIDRSMNNVSGGQLKRIGLIRTILKRSQIYLFDEPTSGLDEFTAESVTKFLNEYAVDNFVVIVTHDTTLSSTNSNYVYL